MPILAFLTAKRLGLANWLWIILAFAALAALYLWFRAEEKADDKANQEIGRTIERETNLTETIKRTEQGNEAREEIKRDLDTGGRSAAVHDQCLRTARTASNCERYLPHNEAD